MQKTGVAIQQLYEDIATTTYATLPAIKGVKLEENSVERNLDSHYPRSTRLGLLGPRQRQSSNIPTPDGRMDRRLSMGPSRLGTPNAQPKMTNFTALGLFGDKLTPYEKEEIKAYPDVYCIGLTAKKLGFNLNDVIKRPADLYDDSEHFYKVVPLDHIAYRYEVTDNPILGKGTFGQVVKAFDHKLQRFVALKMVRNEKNYLKQSREELRLLQYLRRQDVNSAYNIVTLYEFFIFRSHMVISFELLGINLYQVLKRNKYRGLALTKVRLITQAVLRCLELLFRNRIIHCDIKPENIMLRKPGEYSNVKVGDFGSSCYEQQQIYHYIQSRYYRAPEVILGIRYGPAIDMWSLGCVLGELATGRPIFTGYDEFDQLAAIEEVMGPVPSSMLAGHKVKARAPRSKSRKSPGTITLSSILPRDEQFKSMVKKILQLDPEMRPTPTELQEHPWVLCKAIMTSPISGYGTKQGSYAPSRAASK